MFFRFHAPFSTDFAPGSDIISYQSIYRSSFYTTWSILPPLSTELLELSQTTPLPPFATCEACNEDDKPRQPRSQNNSICDSSPLTTPRPFVTHDMRGEDKEPVSIVHSRTRPSALVPEEQDHPAFLSAQTPHPLSCSRNRSSHKVR